MSGRLDAKVAVITGAASGIGEATARRFAEEGARIIVADVQVDEGEALARSLGDAVFVHTDVMSEAAVAGAIATAVDRFGRLDCIVNNAGFVGGIGSIKETPADHWRATLAVLLDGVFYGCKHAAKAIALHGEGGTILTTTSVAGLRGGFGAHAYTTAKHAVIGLTRSIAAELAPEQIRANAVAPGGVLSALTTALVGSEIDAETLDRMAAEGSPMKVATYPREIANAFVYLASDESAHVTGQVITVDAGATMAPEIPSFHTSPVAFLGPQSVLSASQK